MVKTCTCGYGLETGVVYALPVWYVPNSPAGVPVLRPSSVTSVLDMAYQLLLEHAHRNVHRNAEIPGRHSSVLSAGFARFRLPSVHALPVGFGFVGSLPQSGLSCASSRFALTFTDSRRQTYTFLPWFGVIESAVICNGL